MGWGEAQSFTMMMYQLLTTVSSNRVTAREGGVPQANAKGLLCPRVTAYRDSCHQPIPQKVHPLPAEPMGGWI